MGFTDGPLHDQNQLRGRRLTFDPVRLLRTLVNIAGDVTFGVVGMGAGYLQGAP